MGAPMTLLFSISQLQGCTLFDSCSADWVVLYCGPKEVCRTSHAMPPTRFLLLSLLRTSQPGAWIAFYSRVEAVLVVSLQPHTLTAISHLNVFTQKEKVINAGQYIFLELISRLELPKYLSGVSTKEFADSFLSFLTTCAYVWKNNMDHCLSLFLGNLHVPKIYKQTTDRKKSPEPGGKKHHFLAYDCQSQNTLGYSLTIIDSTISESHPLPGSKIALTLVQEG